MRTILRLAAATSRASLLALSTGPAAADEPQRAFPTYSREDVAKACMNEYGIGNSSILDCMSTDEKYRLSLTRRWAEIDDALKTDCLTRLAHQRMNSYFHLDGCIQSTRRAAETPD